MKNNEILDLIEKLNNELVSLVGGEKEIEYLCGYPLSFSSDGFDMCVSLFDRIIWDNINFSEYDDDDNEIDLESHLRKEIFEYVCRINRMAGIINNHGEK